MIKTDHHLLKRMLQDLLKKTSTCLYSRDS